MSLEVHVLILNPDPIPSCTDLQRNRRVVGPACRPDDTGRKAAPNPALALETKTSKPLILTRNQDLKIRNSNPPGILNLYPNPDSNRHS